MHFLDHWIFLTEIHILIRILTSNFVRWIFLTEIHILIRMCIRMCISVKKFQRTKFDVSQKPLIQKMHAEPES